MAQLRGILVLAILFALAPRLAAENEGLRGPRVNDPKELQERLRRTVDDIAAATVRVDTPEGMGSGTIIAGDGTILTSAHVIEGSNSVTVTLSDGRRYEAIVLGINGAGDLALLRIEAEGLRPVALGDSDAIVPRQWVVAAGHPVSAFDDFQPTISIGLVSKVDGTIRADRKKVFHSAIVSDVPLSPGSSGGGLYDLEGRLVAVNAAVTRDERGAFSVRISEYRRDAERLLRGDRFDRRADRVPAVVPPVDEEAARSRNAWFGNRFLGERDRLTACQVELRRGRESFSGIVVSANGDVLAPARFFRDLEPGAFVGGFEGDAAVDLRFVGSDFANGVALLRLPEGAPRAHFELDGGVELRRGDLALTLRGDTVTGGVVAAASRVPPLVLTDSVYYPDVIQVDLRLFRSERGSPVVGLDGALLGMVVQHRLKEENRRWSSAPYGAFLLPRRLLAESHLLLSRGEARGERPVGFLGVGLEDMTESTKARLEVADGVQVEFVEQGMPAWRGGIRRGDVILAIGGEPVSSRGEAIGRIAGYRRGDRVSVTFRRDRETVTVEVEMAERSDRD